MNSTVRAYPAPSLSESLRVLFNRPVAYSILGSIVSLLFARWLWSLTAGKHIFLPILVATVWSARSWGAIPSIASSLTGLIGVWYWIVPPQYSFRVHDRADIIGLVLFAAVSVCVIVMLRVAGPMAEIVDGFEVDALKTARLAMQGLLTAYRQVVCSCEGGGHNLTCMAHPSSPIILRAEFAIRWMYRAEEAAEERKLPARARRLA
jgi:hypothetical protein